MSPVSGETLRVRWPEGPVGRARYESLFLRAVDPAGGGAVWLRHTVQHRADDRPGDDHGAAWCVVWDAEGRPSAAKQTWNDPQPSGPDGAWIGVGDGGPRGEATVGEHGRLAGGGPAGGGRPGGGRPGGGRSTDRGPAAGREPTAADAAAGAAGSRLGPFGSRGRIAAPVPATWDLRFAGGDQNGLRHLPFARLYTAPLPKTKVTSPLTGLRVSGTVRVGEAELVLDEAPAVLGHNWGAEHAHRWLWLNGLGFPDRPDTWFDVAMARIAVGPAVLPWAGIGALQLDGRRIPLGLSARRGPGRVRVDVPGRLVAELPARDGHLTVELDAPTTTMVAWPYAQPGGGPLHHALNCSRANVRLTWRPRSGAPLVLESPVGGVLEQGVPASEDHPVAVLPFTDG